MEFPEAGRESARRFLEYFLSHQRPPSSSSSSSQDDECILPVSCNWPTVSKEEVEAESLDIARNLLCKSSCPGLLAYHIAAAAVSKLLGGSLEEYEVLAKEEDASKEDREVSTDRPQAKRMLDGKLLARAVVTAVHEICQEWSRTLPLLTCPRERREISIFASRNGRRKMEDRHSICADLNSLYGFKDCPDQSFFAVFDGHVGAEAAAYSAVHLYHNIARHPSLLTDPELAIKEAVRMTDERCCEKNWRSGSTAVLALLRGESELYVGWVGDSQAMLFRKGGEAVQIMQPHKPDNEDERQRIEEAGGLVIFVGVWRVNGSLSVSRAIGDAKEKKYIIGEADVTKVTLEGTEEYLVIACDGVWDVVNGEEMVECVRDHFLKGGTKQTTAKAICDFARSEGSSDNLTAIVIFFKDFKPPQPPQEKEKKEEQCPSPPSASAETT